MATNHEAFDEARQFIPGGVNSPVRAFRAVGGTPVFFASGFGCKVTDIEGREYIDYVGSWGPHILGHAQEKIVNAIARAARASTSFGAPTVSETALAKAIIEDYPNCERVRLTNSGTEAVMSALRLARGFTHRSRIVKFAGCYHGHVDSLLVAAGSGALTFGSPDSGGVTPAVAQDTIVLPYNDVDAVERAFAQWGGEIACTILEPVAGNMGVVLPTRGFLESVAAITRENGALFIMDEVMTGYRVALGGAQQLFNVLPDLTVLGKIIGGGMPLAAFGGRSEIMDQLAPLGPVYQAGTLSGNPVAVSAGLAALTQLRSHREIYARLEVLSARLAAGLSDAAEAAGVPLYLARCGSMLTPFFQQGPVRNLEHAKKSDTARFSRFHAAMLKRGIYLPPSQFEAWFVSNAHTFKDIDATVEAARESFVDCAA
ncbi:MAG: glutamate-1-semialdehyde 2,1-aminomutase [Planctomycetaceae bacterium]|nr:Glutamate-1-semialdehyde 2,1-aminomutase [Planctomycetota bacterium]MCQ3950759.1 glutamate-1-semialdehyde-2,1-aminomutase [Planctomycetota bacterium]NUO15671.1 glutamate-1-semialdehyde 2,1-aminomutase [Planctomycetaceae bacterium]GIK53280.1 MAG: glutamate-1-semialdehyde 2,1-aminomutase [Planctomycetota bacterium]HRJ79266.1 glutamate-1-semialdehyde 2,1-aminomutase [Planctomycetota bacterium]